MRKRVFALSIIMSAASMLVLFLVMFGFLQNAFLEYLEGGEWITDIDEDAEEVEWLLMDWSESGSVDWDELQCELDEYGYALYVGNGGEAVYPADADEWAQKIASIVEANEGGGIHAAFGYTFVDCEMTLGGGSRYLLAVSSEQGAWQESAQTRSDIYFYRTLLIGAATIALLIALGWLLSRRIVNQITEPLELLLASLRRAAEGDMETPIVYRGDREFQTVCEAFNRMQEDVKNHENERREQEERRIDMVTNISHDLRTPLTAIKGYIKAVLDGVADTPPKQRECLTIAYDTTDEMDALLQKLLLFSKIETGKMPLEPTLMNLSEFLQDYVKKRNLQYGGKRVCLTADIQSSAYEGRYDALQMWRILDNLLENSLRYAGTDPVEITISYFCDAAEEQPQQPGSERSQSGSELQQPGSERSQSGSESVQSDRAAERICFHDNGVGVPEDKLPHIFERFYRCDESRGQDGNGVGLYIVKYLTEAQGGTVEAVNQDGFSVNLYFGKA